MLRPMSSIPSSPTISPDQRPFLRVASTNILMLRSTSLLQIINVLVRGYRGFQWTVLDMGLCPLRALSVPKGPSRAERMSHCLRPTRREWPVSSTCQFLSQCAGAPRREAASGLRAERASEDCDLLAVH
jgi:hypothetical protein